MQNYDLRNLILPLIAVPVVLQRIRSCCRSGAAETRRETPAIDFRPRFFRTCRATSVPPRQIHSVHDV